MDIWIIYERIDDDSHWQDPTIVNILGAFDDENEATKYLKECEEDKYLKGQIIIESVILTKKEK